jgi:hypothetical protein
LKIRVSLVRFRSRAPHQKLKNSIDCAIFRVTILAVLVLRHVATDIRCFKRKDGLSVNDTQATPLRVTRGDAVRLERDGTATPAGNNVAWKVGIRYRTVR